MVKRNINMEKLKAGYLFPEIGRRRREFQANNPDAKIISLGIGDTTEPLTPFITEKLTQAAAGLGSEEGYSGYGAEQGMDELRKGIADTFYKGLIDPSEVFVSDGAKPDTGRIQIMFGKDATLAVQDPAYPVYVDSSVMIGQTQNYNPETKQFDGIEYMPCKAENDFFPDLTKVKRTDLIFFCSPNNPTGAVANREQLTKLVEFAKKNKSIIIFDSAYSMFIKDENLPKSIYEIEGAKEVAMEVSSFSKPAGFTGVRLGWTVVPKELKFDDGTPVINDFNRVTTTIFNGASNVVQHGGIAAVSEKGRIEMKDTIAFYMENAKIIKTALIDLGYECYGGENAPYVWTKIPGKTSWEAFDEILNKCHVVCTPGAGFGEAGEGFVRFSSFGHRANVIEAVERLKKLK